MAEVFVSYARENRAAAKRVAEALRAGGFAVWWDDDLPAHRAYSEIIEQRLKDSAAVVALWSKAAAGSQWVRAEADFARSAGKLVQARLDAAMPPMPFNQIECADLKGWRGSADHRGWAKLVASVGELTRHGPQPRQRAGGWRRHLTLSRIAAALAAAAFLVGLVLMLPRLTGSSAEAGTPVLAVLPFESVDRRDESLVAGIWEDTRQAISRNPNILVLGPNTSEELARSGGKAARKAADYLLRASVRSVGDRIRVTTALIRTSDDAQLWGDRFDRKLDDVFALQSEIAQLIEGRIRGRLAKGGGVQPQNIATSGEVYALYSDARAKIRKRDAARYQEAYRQLQQVTRADPNFAPGWATLSVIKMLGFDPGSSVASAEADARRAVSLAPNLAAAHAALGFALRTGPAAQAELRRAIALDPHDFEALNWLAISLDPVAQVDERLRIYQRIVEIEPLWWPGVWNNVNLLWVTGNAAAVERELARVERLGNERVAVAVKSLLLARKGDLSGAIDLGLEYYRRAGSAGRSFIAEFMFQPLVQLGHFELADKLRPPPPHPWIAYLRRNDPQAIDLIESGVKAEQFWNLGPLPIIAGRIYLNSGQGLRLARRYRAAASSPQEFEALVGKDAFRDIVPIAALALQSAGENEEAAALLERAQTLAEASNDGSADSQIQLARIYAVQGRHDEAIGLLGRAVGAGWLPPYLPIHTDIGLDPPLAELKHDPRFQRLRKQILDHLAKERAELGPVKLG